MIEPGHYRRHAPRIEDQVRERWNAAQGDAVDLERRDRPKRYILGMFPYPSGNAHLGHVRVYSLSDAMARLYRFKGHEVLHPIGWDAFGLPAENAAIERGIPPREWTRHNIERMRTEQFNRLGFSFDWDQQVNTSEPDYYRWTQWLFLALYEAGLVERRRAPVNWCNDCDTVLANEQVIGDRCWRHDDTVVTKRELEQWFIRTTAFAQAMWDGLDDLRDWSADAVAIQRHWIGRSEGVRFHFPVAGGEAEIPIFTTRPDTVWGVTSMTLAPEHPLLLELVSDERRAKVETYVEAARSRSDVERAKDAERTGVYAGFQCINPVNGDLVPVWVSDYVIGGYGTGAIMNVPAHDERDFDFARLKGLPVKTVIEPARGGAVLTGAWTAPGTMRDSGPFSGMPSDEAIPKIGAWAEEQDIGTREINFKLRDWLVSRQRYWGAPIPMVHCDACGWSPVPADQLPVLLPEDVRFSEKGSSPLAAVEEFVRTECPKCARPARREVDTMDTFMCSSWYAFRFTDAHNEERIFDPERGRHWMPIDWYVGGLEHAAQHMIYHRFIGHFFHSRGWATQPEPVQVFLDNGMVRLGGAKMSKSRGNTVAPTEIVSQVGADALRLYILADAPPRADIDWDDSGLAAKKRFLDSIWDLYARHQEQLAGAPAQRPEPADTWERELLALLHRSAHGFDAELHTRSYHNAVALIHSFIGAAGPALREARGERQWLVAGHVMREFLKVLGLFCPHLAEALWHSVFDAESSLFDQSWVEIDPALLVGDTIDLVVQVNGKHRGTIQVPRGVAKDQAREAALSLPGVQRAVAGKATRRVVFVPERLINLVVG